MDSMQVALVRGVIQVDIMSILSGVLEEKTILWFICRLYITGYLHVLDIGNTEGKLVGVKEYQVPAISLYRKIKQMD